MSSRGLTSPRRVSFASDVTVWGGSPPQDNLPNIVLPDPPCPELVEEADMDTIGAATELSGPIVPPPLGFRQFSWPREKWSVGGEPSLFDFAMGLPGWLPWCYGIQPVNPPSLPVSPVLQGGLDDSVIANEGSSREESNITSHTIVVAQAVGDALLVEMDSKTVLESPPPEVVEKCSKLPWRPIADDSHGRTNHQGRRSLGGVPRWRQAREGPFLAERSSSSLPSSGAGCAFRNTTYHASDYASPSGVFGIRLNHPRFLEWVRVPESAGLLERGPGQWLNALS